MSGVDPKSTIRRALLRAGRRASPSTLANLRSCLSYLELGAWLAGKGEHVAALPEREDLFAETVARVHGARPLYLEFGVYAGESMRWWAKHLTMPGARFVGFDSFEGLPEDWRPNTPAGHFAVGEPPTIDDPRVSFAKGWFNETLPTFTLPEHDQLVVNVDCDLYSSADTVLRALEPHLVPGTLIYFDELPDRDHEMRALMESLTRTGARITPIAIARGGIHWLFEYEAV
jgi:hypothetical protein